MNNDAIPPDVAQASMHVFMQNAWVQGGFVGMLAMLALFLLFSVISRSHNKNKADTSVDERAIGLIESSDNGKKFLENLISTLVKQNAENNRQLTETIDGIQTKFETTISRLLTETESRCDARAVMQNDRHERHVLELRREHMDVVQGLVNSIRGSIDQQIVAHGGGKDARPS